MSNKLLVPLLVIVLIGGVVAVAYNVYTSTQHPAQRISYPYVCKDCKAVFDVQEAKKPGNWRSPKGAPSDSVICCLRCGQGWAYPVTRCEKCGTQHILHLCKDNRCPKCVPQAAEAAKKAGVDTLYQGG